MHANRPIHSPRCASDIALRARLCRFALQTPHAQAFHLGNIVRIAFLVAYFARDVADETLVHDLIHTEHILCDIAARAAATRSWRLVGPIDETPLDAVLDAYDHLLTTASPDTLLRVEHAAEANFAAPADQRQSIRELLA
jgi:hypothetical protein